MILHQANDASFDVNSEMIRASTRRNPQTANSEVLLLL
jgi:hypothetical protein